ncbi:MAG: hypothetical protein KDN20_18270 [Verrucomicrobiae bacterium]|nr:hypothetical protein [Verrucomicrobiae bacterium]
MRFGKLNLQPIPFGPLASIAGVLVALLLLPMCESARKGTLHQPLEFFLLSDQLSDATPVPYADPTGAITGFVSHQPNFVITRLDELIIETRQLPIFVKGRITGKQPHRFAHLYLQRKDREHLAAFSETAVGKVLLVRMAGLPLSTTFVTAPMEGDSFVISGPANEETLLMIQTLQASLDGDSEVARPLEQK